MSSIQSLLRSVCDAEPEQPGELVMLATQLGVSPRTARACCRRLKAVMLALEAANDGATRPPPGETRWLSTVRMGARLLTIEAEPSVAATASRILEQLEDTPSNQNAHPRPSDQDLRAMVVRAVTERRVLSIEYQNANESGCTAREVEPLSLTNVDGHWTFLAFCRVRKDLRSFRFDRVRDCAVTAQHYEARHGLSLERYLHQQKARTRSRAAV